MTESNILQYARVYLTSGHFMKDAGTVREIRDGKALVKWDDAEEPAEVELSRPTLLYNRESDWEARRG